MSTDVNDDSNQTELREELQDLENVEDESAGDEEFSGQFAISSFGADYNVDSLVRRMESKAFYKPEFQTRIRLESTAGITFRRIIVDGPAGSRHLYISIG